MRRLRLLMLVLVVNLGMAGCATAPAPATMAKHEVAMSESARLQARAQRVEILRDDFGVPHIYGKTDADAVFGLLYAQAEDDFPRIERNYLWAMGRLSEVQGEAALYSDLRANLYMTRAEADSAYATAPEWLRELCRAFADGLNHYLATHPEVKPLLLTRFEPWMPFYFFEGSIGGDIESVPLDGIAAFYGRGRANEAELPMAQAAAANTPAVPAPATMAKPEFAEPSGSNGWAISGSRSQSGHPLLLINPHTSFFFRGEVHVVSEEGLNVYGAVTWGQFFVYQGFNETTGWMHTTTRADFMDDYVQQVVRDGDALKYRYGTELRPLESFDVTLKYRDGDTLRSRSFPVYRTHQGPITHALGGRWATTRINWHPVDALRQSWLRMKQSDYAGFREVMQIRSNSSNNTVFADASGNIAYFHGNFMPKRDPAFDYAKPVEGSDPRTDWQGVHALDEMITLLNPENGWLQNSNSTPFTAALEHSPKREDYPAYMAPDAETYRAIHAVRLLKDANDLTLDGLIELAYDPELPAFEVLLPGLFTAYDHDRKRWPQLEAPIALLRRWDRKVALDSVAMTLAHFYGVAMFEHLTRPVAMADVEWAGRDSAPEVRLAAFAATLSKLQADFGTWAVPWREVNRYQRLDGAIEQGYDDAQPSLPVAMASGSWGALAAFGAVPGAGTKRIYGQKGNSFVAVVEFGPRLRAKSLLAGGQSGDPRSPHFADQAERYAARQFKDVAFYREDVERRAQRRYRP
ncbi:MAG TPA: penicillin acylase family protein [Patescibacteria group bacterium]|nr:penicillin acylase family protein [Patescibacteria group bacterium]